MDNYRRQLFESEFGKKDDYGKLKLGIVLFLIVVTIVGAVFVHFKTLEIQEKEKQRQAQIKAYQDYYNQQRWNQYNQSLNAIVPITTPIKIN